MEQEATKLVLENHSNSDGDEDGSTRQTVRGTDAPVILPGTTATAPNRHTTLWLRPIPPLPAVIPDLTNEVKETMTRLELDVWMYIRNHRATWRYHYIAQGKDQARLAIVKRKKKKSTVIISRTSAKS